MGFFPDVNKLWEHMSRVMNFLTADTLALFLFTQFRVILRMNHINVKTELM